MKYAFKVLLIRLVLYFLRWTVHNYVFDISVSLKEVEFEEKVREILDVLDTCHDSVASGDIRERVKELAISRGGLVNNDVRSRAWPVLLGVDVSDIPPKPGKHISCIPQHCRNS